MGLVIKPKQGCRWDLVSLGEVMLRFDPGDRRISTARKFDVGEGGGEYNVARGLKRCFGLDTAIVTAFTNDPVGQLLQDLIYQGGVDQSLVRWLEHDGIDRGSHDLNYRASLWKAKGGKNPAQQVKRRIAHYGNVMLGNEEDFSAALGYDVPGMDEHHSKFEVDGFKQMIAKVVTD